MAISTTYVVKPKIIHHLVHVLQSNIPMNILQSCIHMWNYIYENLVVISVGLNLFGLLGSSSSSSVDASSFGFVLILCLYLTLNFTISSLIVEAFVSARKTLLDICHGAHAIARRNLFWYFCNISMFELLAVSQRGIPYVH